MQINIDSNPKIDTMEGAMSSARKKPIRVAFGHMISHVETSEGFIKARFTQTKNGLLVRRHKSRKAVVIPFQKLWACAMRHAEERKGQLMLCMSEDEAMGGKSRVPEDGGVGTAYTSSQTQTGPSTNREGSSGGMLAPGQFQLL